MSYIQNHIRLVKRMVKIVLERLFWTIKYIKKNTKISGRNETVIGVLRDKAISSSAEYVELYVSQALLFERKEMLWDLALSNALSDGICLEFGVFSGYSINYFAKKLKKQRFFGFDSFEGLSEDWYGTSSAKGTFNRNGALPRTCSNVVLIKGWFQESVPTFVQGNTERVSLIHFDADTYETTKFLLKQLKQFIKKDLIIIFDEYLGFPNWQNGEYLAWKEFVLENGISYKYIGFSNEQVVIKLL